MNTEQRLVKLVGFRLIYPAGKEEASVTWEGSGWGWGRNSDGHAHAAAAAVLSAAAATAAGVAASAAPTAGVRAANTSDHKHSDTHCHVVTH